MSKRVVISAAAAAISAFAGPAFAQDAYDWTGFYIGAHAGMNWGDANNETLIVAGGGPVVIPPEDIARINAGIDNSENGGFTGGAQFGYNYQMGGLVLGLETDIGVLALDQDNSRTFASAVLINPPVAFTVSQKVSSDWMWTVRPRIGWAGGPWMLYLTGGFAMANIKLETSYVDTAVPSHAAILENEETRAGWAVGVGGAWAFNENWSVGAEWLYADFGTVDATATSNGGFATLITETNPRANIVRGRVDFNF
jgi:outer membrane immunogenic protein